MKRLLLMFVAISLFLIPNTAYADNDYEKQLNEITEEYGVDYSAIENITLEGVLQSIIERIKQRIYEPLDIFFKMGAIIFLCSILKVIQNDKKSDIIDTVCTLIVFLSLLGPIRNIISMVEQNIFSIKNFMVSFIPVFCGVSMASGEFVTATIYNGFFLTSLIFVASFCIKIVLPSINLFFALIVSNSLSPFIKLKSLSDFYLKAIKWAMKSAVSIICFALTLQTIISQGKDTLTVKTGKLFAGSAIPIIGSTLQDAIGSVFASMETIKGFAGAAGLLVVTYIFLPSIIALAIHWLYVNGLYIISDMFEIQSISSCIQGFIQIIELMISIIFLFMIMLIFSITIMISLTNGV